MGLRARSIPVSSIFSRFAGSEVSSGSPALPCVTAVVDQWVKALEEELGGRLFKRHPHFELTDLGIRVLLPLRRVQKAVKELAAIAIASARSAPSYGVPERNSDERQLRVS